MLGLRESHWLLNQCSCKTSPEVSMPSISSLLGGKDGSVLSSRLEEVVGGQIAWLSMFCQRWVLARVSRRAN